MPAGEGWRDGFASLTVLLSLATFTAVFLWNGSPPSFATMWSDPRPGDAELRK